MERRILIVLIAVLCSCKIVCGFQWQIEVFDHNIYTQEICYANVGGQPAIVYYGERVFIDGDWEAPIKYAVRTADGWEAETVVPAEEKPVTVPLLLAGLGSGAPAICFGLPAGSPPYRWYATKTLTGWQREAIWGEGHPTGPTDLRTLCVSTDGEPIIGEGNNLGAWYRGETDWRGVQLIPGVAYGGQDYKTTPDGRVAAVYLGSIPEGYGYAITSGDKWIIGILPELSSSQSGDYLRLIVFDDGHAGIAHVNAYFDGQELKFWFMFTEEDGFRWNSVKIEDSLDFDHSRLSELIALRNGEPAIAYSCKDAQENMYYVKYAWRENGVWLKDTVLSSTYLVGVVGLELIDGLPWIAYWSGDLLHFAFPLADRTLTVNVEPNDIGIDSVTPEVGQYSYYPNDVVALSTERFVRCPDVYQFGHWVGDVNDANSPSTTATMDADKTVTAVFTVDSPECGDECHPNFLLGDLNHDCYINFKDMAMLASRWATCMAPECD